VMEMPRRTWDVSQLRKALTLLLFWGRRVGSIGFAESRMKHGRASDSKQPGLSSFFPFHRRHGERRRHGIARIQIQEQKKEKEKGRTSQPN
jgi:hypothetical protein